MGKKLFSLLFINLLLSTALCAQITLEGKVVDQKGFEIPFASIGIPKTATGVASFEDGSFSLEVPKENMNQSVVFSALGYERKTISVKQLASLETLEIQLSQEERVLNEVIVSPGSLKTESLGKWRRFGGNTLSFSKPAKGAEIAGLVQLNHKPSRLESIQVKVSASNLGSYEVRCRFYTLDPESGLPLEDLYLGDFIQKSSVGDGKLTFDFSALNLWLDQPFFVSFEWIVNKKQAEMIDELFEKMPKDFFDEYEEKYPGTSGQIFNNSEVRLVDSVGHVKQTFPLSKADRKYLKERDSLRPKVGFRMTEGDGKIYYRGSAQGKWVVYNEVLIKRVKVSY